MFADLRFALRGFARAPGFTVAAIGTLALGIGAMTAIFSIADALMFRPLPFPNANRLVLVWDQLRKLGIDRFPLNDQTFREYAAQTSIFESTAGFRLEEGDLIGGAETAHALVLDVTPSMFSLLAVKPTLGRTFSDGETDAALLSYSLFVRRFAADPAVIGRSIRLDDRIFKIAGVLPAGFEFSNNTDAPDLWIPLLPNENGRWSAVTMLARLDPGVSIRAAQASMDVLSRHLEDTLHLYRGPHDEDRGYAARVVSLHDEWLGQFRAGAIILLAAAGAVLLIVLANVANLMLVRAVSREKEFAVRRAVGASEARLAGQWITESALLVFFGAATGAIASLWATKAVVALSPAQLPPGIKIGVDARALLAALAISAIACLIFGFAPAISERRVYFQLYGYAPKRSIAPLLVAIETALATMLLIGAGLLLKSFETLRHVEAGFNGENLLTMQVSLPTYRYPQDRGAVEFFTQVRERLSALPGVLVASSGTRLPINGPEIFGRGAPFGIEGSNPSAQQAAQQTARSQTIDLDYFRTLEIPLLAGRVFSSADAASSTRVAIVNETFARQFFPDGRALGRRIAIGPARTDAAWMTIIGIAGDIKAASLDEQTLPHIYMPLAQHPSRWMALAVRTAGDPMQIAREAAGVIRGLDPDASPTTMMTMSERLDRSISRPRFETAIVAFFASAALFLAGIGIFGVVAHATARKALEIGIRMALGADRRRILGEILVGGMRPVIAGIGCGLAGALAIGRSVSTLLFHVKPADPVIFAGAALLLTGVAVAALLLPARRAAFTDPMIALRAE
jgi:putative ABC transport system permease protein